MKISLIINSAALDPFVAPVKSMHAHTPYSARVGFMRDVILPAARNEGWDEIIVCGTFETGDSYTYIPMNPIFRDRRDALWQRELGARHATGDILAFSHDDHMFSPGVISRVWTGIGKPWDILVPKRITRDGRELNNGAQEGYMGGHCLLMKRAIWAQVPWTTVDTEWWDVSMTRVWKQEGAKVVHTDTISHIDLDEPVLTS